MKQSFSVLFGAFFLTLFTLTYQQANAGGSGDKVLLIIREQVGTSDLQLMRTDEALLMKSTLEEAGFRVEIGSASGRTFLIKKIALESDVKLADVNADDYAGVIITCSNLNVNTSSYTQTPAYGETYVKPQEVEIVKQIVAAEIPLAAQDKAVIILAQAGVLTGKKYSYEYELQISEAIYGGQSVIRDGNIFTSSHCPYDRSKDQTIELTNTLIAELRK